MCRRRKLDAHRRAGRGGPRRCPGSTSTAPARARLARDPRGVRGRPRPRRRGGGRAPRARDRTGQAALARVPRRGRRRARRVRLFRLCVAGRGGDRGRRSAGAVAHRRGSRMRCGGSARWRPPRSPPCATCPGRGRRRSCGGWRPSGGCGPSGSAAASCGRRRRLRLGLRRHDPVAHQPARRSAPPARSGRARRAAASCRARAPGSAGSSRASRRTRRPRRRRTAAPTPAAARGARSRTPFSSVAPAMIGSAACRDSRLASTRVNRRHRAAASVAPLRETPGNSEHACATPSHSASSAPASACVRSWGERSASAIATAPDEQTGRDRRRRPEVPLDRPLEPVADHRRRGEREADHHHPPQVQPAHGLVDLTAAG